MSAIQQTWSQAASTEERLKILSVEGKRSAVELNRSLVAAYRQCKGAFWPFAVSKALERSTHARADPGWPTAASRFLISGRPETMTAARGFSSSFGADALQRALISFRQMGEFTGLAYGWPPKPPAPPDAAALVRAQEAAVRLAMKRELPGLGAWLFCAPFHLLALMQPSLWENPILDQLLLPLGSPVARGYGMLQRAGMIDIEEQLLRDTEPGIRNGLTLLYIARGAAQQLAVQAGVRALFIHQGAESLGQLKP